MPTKKITKAELFDILEEESCECIDTDATRHGVAKVYVYRDAECRQWRFEVRFEGDEGIQVYGDTTCQEVRPEEVRTIKYVAVKETE